MKFTPRPFCLALLLSSAGISLAAQPQRPSPTPAYPHELSQSDARFARAYAGFARAVGKKHDWIKSFGTASPVVTKEIDGKSFYVVSGCKPQECPMAKYVVLIDKASYQTVGALIENKTAGVVLKQSSIQWLGEPDERQLTEIASQLF
jgi:hypothetical protein